MSRRIPLLALVLPLLLGACTAPTPTAQATPAPAVADTAVPTPTPYPTYTPPPTYTPEPTYTPVPTYTPLPTYTAEPTRTPKPTQRPAPAATATPLGGITITIQKYNYGQWGRPAGMDQPGAGCGPFDDSRPVMMLSASLLVENKTTKDMVDWYGHFFDPADRELYTCYYHYGEIMGPPSIPAGQTVELTFAVFVEQGGLDIHGYVSDPEAGRSNEVTFPFR